MANCAVFADRITPRVYWKDCGDQSKPLMSANCGHQLSSVTGNFVETFLFPKEHNVWHSLLLIKFWGWPISRGQHIMHLKNTLGLTKQQFRSPIKLMDSLIKNTFIFSVAGEFGSRHPCGRLPHPPHTARFRSWVSFLIILDLTYILNDPFLGTVTTRWYGRGSQQRWWSSPSSSSTAPWPHLDTGIVMGATMAMTRRREAVAPRREPRGSRPRIWSQAGTSTSRYWRVPPCQS